MSKTNKVATLKKTFKDRERQFQEFLVQVSNLLLQLDSERDRIAESNQELDELIDIVEEELTQVQKLLESK